jgi:prevent-host-death family protein
MARKHLEADADAAPNRPASRFASPVDTRAAGEALALTTVGIRELARNVSGVVAAVASSGRPTVVTKHGQPVAVVVSLTSGNLGERVLADEAERRFSSAVQPAVADEVEPTAAAAL